MNEQGPASESKPKLRVLILASKLGYQTRGFADAAEKLGAEIVFATDRCHKLEDPWGDGALPLQFERPEESAEEIARAMGAHPPNTILALGDRATTAAACAARALGLPGNSPESAAICRNKLRQRETVRKAGLPVPEFFAISLDEEIERILPRVGFPCVLKPLGLAASQGVIRADDERSFAAALNRIRALLESPEIQVLREPGTEQVLVEKYIPGKEFAIEGLMTEGRLRVLAIFDKPEPLEGPYFEETIYVTPSRLADAAQTELCECARKTVRALGLQHGPLHAEFRMNERGPWVLEAAARPIGGLCSRALRFGPEKISLEELLLRHALGLAGSELEREAQASGVMMIPVPRSGIFEGVKGLEEAEKLSGVEEIRITVRLKDYIAAWPEGSSYLGFIFARAEKPNEVEEALHKAHARMQFVFSPRLPVEHPVTRRISA
ncbi:MAG: ATP-grasp domain-containing protein [Candidatus Acidiferrales bacterium]